MGELKEKKKSKTGNSKDKRPTNRTIIEVKVNGAEKRYKPTRHYVFIMQVRFSDETEYVIYRSYADFYAFQISLLDKFPIEAGEINSEDRVIPYLPGRRIFHRNEVQKVANKRQGDLAQYCTELLQIKDNVSKDKLVSDFFEVKVTDRNPPSESRKKPEKSFLSSLFSKSKSDKNGTDGEGKDGELYVSGPMELEEYRVISGYKATDKTEITLAEGQVVDVLQKTATGWWLVQMDHSQGWAPSSYLEPVQQDLEEDDPEPNYEGEPYLTLEAYSAASDDELSFEKGATVDVLHQKLDGWWIVCYNGKVGRVPAIYLEPYQNEHLHRSESIIYGRKKLNPRRHTIKNQKNHVSEDLSMYVNNIKGKTKKKKVPTATLR